MDAIEGAAEILLSPEEAELFERQAEAQASADVGKEEAEYQNEPKGDQQCDGCSMFVPGLPDDVGGYCTKVRSFRGPLGMIFPDGWCKFYEPMPDDDDVEAMLAEPPIDE